MREKQIHFPVSLRSTHALLHLTREGHYIAIRDKIMLSCDIKQQSKEIWNKFDSSERRACAWVSRHAHGAHSHKGAREGQWVSLRSRLLAFAGLYYHLVLRKHSVSRQSILSSNMMS